MLELAGPYYRDNGACPYLAGRAWAADYLLTRGDVAIVPHEPLVLAQNSFVDPDVRLPAATPAPKRDPRPDALDVFGRLLDAGFRRAGRTFYRPACEGCRECVSIRVVVDAFRPSGDQKRALRKNADVQVEIDTPSFSDEKLELYRAFLADRYPDGEPPTESGYLGFFVDHLGNTREFRYRIDGRLVGVGIVDLARHGASSVYFFFDPGESARSLGTYSALREIDFCRQTGRSYLYLGFRVAGCRAMAYKSNYRPHQLLDERLGWRDAR
jgi:arginine-tRNA-protein transferase